MGVYLVGQNGGGQSGGGQSGDCASKADAQGYVSAHNGSGTAHNDIRTTMDGKVDKTIQLPDGVDFNAVTTSGFYRLGGAPVNGPTQFNPQFGQLIVSCSGDTLLQIVSPHYETRMAIRTGYGIGSTNIWQPWRELNHEDNLPTQMAYRPMTSDIHDWIPQDMSLQGMVVGYGAEIINAPSENWHRYIGMSTCNGDGYITLLAMPYFEQTKVLVKTCCANVWSDWEKLATTLSGNGVIPTSGWWVHPNGYYCQGLATPGVTAYDQPFVAPMLNIDPAADALLQEAWNKISAAWSDTNLLLFGASEIPSVDLPIQWKVVR